MPLTWDEIQNRAVSFAKRWENATDEKSEAQSFIRDFLAVFGVMDASSVGCFEERALRDSGRGFMDYFWPKKIAIEMKSRGKNLSHAYEQLKDYVLHLPAEEMPDLLMVSDFEKIILYRRTTGEKFSFKPKDLRKNIRRFATIAGYETSREYEDQVEVNVKAAEKMAKLHDALKMHGYEGHSLEVYLVRVLFCMFADDTGIFPRDSYLNYIENSKEDGSDLASRMTRLFEILDMPPEVRSKRTLLSPDLLQFRYINGGLFKDSLPSADFDKAMRCALIDCCKFNWEKISPAIFGAMFQGVMDKGRRRTLGAHYTSEENILKLINPLFMKELWQEFEKSKVNPKLLDQFHDKISKLKFLDPACGCGNFLIIAYRELRRLELEILKMKVSTRQGFLDVSSLLRVSVEQFYGIELEDFPGQIAQVGLWLMDHLMNLQVAEQFGQYIARLPLTQTAHITHGNALRLDWNNIISNKELSYLLGNPPFNGYSEQNQEQKDDIISVCKLGKVDYVAAWYFKSANYILGTQIKCAFVSTNSITQGEQVAIIWKPLITSGIYINFCFRSFKWNNDAKGKAAVHCVIIGFSLQKTTPNINPYLLEGPNVFVESRSFPLCDVPPMTTGNRPADGGHLIIENEDYAAFIAKEPNAAKYIKRLIGSKEYINSIPRYCLWLVGVPPSELQHMPSVMKRIELCKTDREKSPDAGRRKLAESPTLFRETNNPRSYLVIPLVSSERRRYIPLGYLDENTIPTNLVSIIPNAGLYHFGILTSSVHMAWVRTVCGRLKSDYRYSKDIVYNNFPWPEANDKQKKAIEKLSQDVLDARALFPDSSLADLYDPLTMPPNLMKAHKSLDAAVMKLYGFSIKDMQEHDCVAELMKLYQMKQASKK